MKTQEALMTYEEIVVPESAMLRVERDTGYGSVPGLEDEELADPAELERQVFIDEWGPILALPCKGSGGGFRPAIDEFGHLDGAFGSVDFARLRPPFDKARYKADILREKLNDVLITLDIVKQRVPATGFLVLKLVQMGILSEEHVTGEDVRALLRLRRRVQSLREEITDLMTSRRRRKEAALQRVAARLAPG